MAEDTEAQCCEGPGDISRLEEEIEEQERAYAKQMPPMFSVVSANRAHQVS